MYKADQESSYRRLARDPARSALFVWLYVAVILLFAVTLPALDVSALSVPYGDHASNSLLVLKAKEFSLLHGNYSRVGFYHPGPYFFYVMAAGEWLLHDLLGVVASPEAAHRIAIALSHLVLLGGVNWLMAKDCQRALVAVLLTLLGLAVMLTSAPVLTSAWPPHMYVIPAFVFSVGLWFLAQSQFHALWAVALGGGILIHGHASNIGLVPIMFVVTAGAMLIVRQQQKKSLHPKDIWSELSPHLMAPGLIFVLFFVPYALQTVLHWPGETPKYFQQAGGGSNDLIPSMRYTLAYWGYWPLLLFAVGGVGLLGYFRPLLAETKTEALSTGSAGAGVVGLKVKIIALAVMCAATTAALLFYAVNGIDYLSESYVGLWYVGAVAATVLIACHIGLTLFAGRFFRHWTSLGRGGRPPSSWKFSKPGAIIP